MAQAVSQQPIPAKPRAPHEDPVPPRPTVDPAKPDITSMELSGHRTDLSTHRTHLSEHRTELSEYRTDLSTQRTELSTDRTDMSMRRTGLSFQRTRMSAERTLMSVIRTSLSLISFGFTIYQIFKTLQEQQILHGTDPARNFGVVLVSLGILMLIVGIVYHLQFMVGLRHERDMMTADGLIYGQSRFPASLTLITALLLLLIGFLAFLNMVFSVGPF